MKLVITDDHRIVRDGLRWMLDDADSIDVVGEAGSGHELLALLAELSVDVALVDVRMPEMGGLEALERIRHDYPQVRVIMLSMHDEPAYVRPAKCIGCQWAGRCENGWVYHMGTEYPCSR